MAKRDEKTPDLFNESADLAPGSLACSIEIAHTMSQALEQCADQGVSRERICDRMSHLLGDRVTVAMLNAYTAVSRQTHQINVERGLAFDAAVHAVTGERPLLKLQARRVGERVISADEAAYLELGRIQQQQRELAERAKALQLLTRHPKR